MRRGNGRRRRTWVLLLLCAALVAVARNERAGTWVRERFFSVSAPLVRAGGSVAGGLNAAADSMRSRRELVAENAELRRSKAVLCQSQMLVDELTLENDRLRALLALSKQVSARTIPASVIGRDSSGRLSAVTINAGSRQGVQKDMAVITPSGVVGRVWSVSSGASLVQLITDRSSGVAAVVQRTRVQGIVNGSGGQEGTLKYIPKLEDVAPEDRIVTSGLDGMFPKGCEIGVVTQVEDPPEFFRAITLKFSVPFNRLEEVLVVDSRNQVIEFPEQVAQADKP